MDPYKITFETYDKVASVYQEKFMDMDLYNDTYDSFCELIEKPDARIFEIGCGPGNITRYLLRKRPGFRIEGIDMAPNMIRLAKANNPGAYFKIMDCRVIDTITDKFDAIMCGFCMPYLSKEDCAKLVKDCSFLLNSGGVFYFSVEEGDYSSSGFQTGKSGHRIYFYYHEESYLQEGLRENNFELVHVMRKDYPVSDGISSTHLIFIARKKL